MSVSPTNTTPIIPNIVRYAVDVGAFNQPNLSVQSANNNAGVWTDIGPEVKVPFPDSCTAAADGVLALVPAILQVLGLVGTPTTTRVGLRSFLTPAKTLDIAVMLQVKIGNQYVVKSIPSLTAFLAANPALGTSVMTAWAAMDAAVNSANASNCWV